MSKPRHAVAPALVTMALFCAGGHPAAAAEPLPPAAKVGRCDRSAFRVVVDVGHTTDKPGADSARGAHEYDFNLRLADDITKALVGAGFTKTVRLITETPPWRGLVERAERANAVHADLFIAIHHDSVPDNLIETWEYQGEKRHFNDRFKGYAIFISDDNADLRGSLRFAHDLGDQLQARGLQYTPHYTLPIMGRYRHQLVDAQAGVYRYDQLVVLRKTLMPAVLLEAGSIVNRQEELELATPERRALTSAAITAAVEDFCATRPQPNIRQAKRRQAPSRSHGLATLLPFLARSERPRDR